MALLLGALGPLAPALAAQPLTYEQYDLFPLTLDSYWVYDDGGAALVSQVTESGGYLWAVITNRNASGHGVGSLTVRADATEVWATGFGNPNYIIVDGNMGYNPFVRQPMSLGLSWDCSGWSNGEWVTNLVAVTGTNRSVGIGGNSYFHCTEVTALASCAVPGIVRWPTSYFYFLPGVGCIKRILIDGAGVSNVTQAIAWDVKGFSTVPFIALPPQSRTNDFGTPASFAVNVTGTSPMTFQWQKEGTNLVDGGSISGATSSNLVIDPLQFSDAGGYSLVVSNEYGVICTTPAALTVNDTVPPDLAISSHADLELLATNVLILEGTASDLGNGDNGITSVTVNGTRAGGDTAGGGGTAGWSLLLLLAPGTNWIAVVAGDGNGNSTTNRIRVISDTTAPTVSFTAPANGQRFTNDWASVAVRATDNIGVAEVWCQLNTNDWTPLTHSNSVWVADVGLLPGTNLLRAYAVDLVGHRSRTNSVSCVHVLFDRLTVFISGLGTLSPNYSNALLEIGQTYSMTARAGAGFAFGNWSGNIATNAPTLTFVMQSNLSFTAHFVDVMPPTLVFTSPAPGQRWSNTVFSVAGTAKDNVAVSNVWVQLNTNAWMQASGTTNWTVDVTLAQGLNRLQANAGDAAGNVSATGGATLTCILLDRLTLSIAGQGTVSPNYSNALLEIGKAYTLTARPGDGCVFSNWTDNAGSVLSDGSVLHFTMRSNLVLAANFVPNPFLAAAGSYAGLFYDTNGITLTNAGLVTVKVTTGGSFSAKLQQGSASYSLAGQFSLAGTWASSALKAAPGWGVSLQLNLVGGDEIIGRITNGFWTAELAANRAVYSRTNPAPQAGKYTLLIPGGADPASQPGGFGFGAVSVNTLGAVAVKGTLGDGTPFTESTFVSKQGQWPLYALPYSKRGLILGWLTFTHDLGATNELEGMVNWIKPGQTGTKLYPDGFEFGLTNGLEAIGSRWTNRLPLLNFSNGVVALEGGNLAPAITNGMTVSASGKVSDDVLTNKFKLTITASSGLFKGSVLDPAMKKTLRFNGALLQDQNVGHGFFLGTNQSGSVFLGPE